MDLKHAKPLLALKLLLQKYIKKLLSDIKEIEASEVESKKEVDILANLLEQRECVARVDMSSLAVTTHFPDVQPKLLVKISEEVDIKLEKLKSIMEPLRKHHAVVYKVRTEAIRLIQKHSESLTLHTLTTGEPTVPPAMVILDWVETVERLMREIYHTRMYYLDNIISLQVVTSESLVSLWLQDMPLLFNTVKDCQEQSIYFVEETYE